MRFRLPFMRSTPADVERADVDAVVDWDADIRRRRLLIGGGVAVVVIASLAWVLLTVSGSSGQASPSPGADPGAARVAQDMTGLDPELLVTDALAASGPEAMRLNAEIPVSTLPNPAMPAFAPITVAPDLATAEDCLTAAIFYEAGYETLDGQRAVGQVVLNRVRHPFYPKSVCGVVLQGFQRPTGCQFSFTCDGAWAAVPDPRRYAEVRAVARAALGGYVHRAVGSATHYHAAYVLPYWAPRLVKVYVSGLHIFYRFPGYIGTAASMRGKYAGQEVIPDERAVLRTTPAEGVVEPLAIEVATIDLPPLSASVPTPEPQVAMADASAPTASPGAASETRQEAAAPAEPERKPPVSYRDDRPLVRPPSSVRRGGW